MKTTYPVIIGIDTRRASHVAVVAHKEMLVRCDIVIQQMRGRFGIQRPVVHQNQALLACHDVSPR